MVRTTGWHRNSIPWGCLFLVTTNVCWVFGFQHPVVTFHNNRFQNQLTQRRSDVPLVSSSQSSSSSSTTLDNINPAHGLLYKEQESMLVQRGILEEEFMKDNYSPLLPPPLPKRRSSGASRKSSSSGGSGFGSTTGGKRTKGSSRNKSSPKDTTVQRPSMYSEEATIYAQELEKQGVVRLDHVLEASLADELRTFVLQLRQDSLQKVVHQRSVPATDRFADVLLRENRCDLKIPLMGNGNRHRTTTMNEQLQQQYNIHMDHTDIVESALHYLLTQSAIPDTIRTVFDRCRRTPQQPSSSPVLYELSTLISDPGSQRQTVHPDNPIRPDGNHHAPVLLTCFIALQDVTEDMGPTVWLPGTHTAAYHDLFFEDQALPDQDESPKDHLLRTHPAVLGTLPKGCCAIYDSRILHCGSANKRQQKPVSSDTLANKNGIVYDDRNSRAIFYFSFRNPEIAYPGNPASIRKDIGQSKITLDQLQDAIQEAVALHPQNNDDDEEQLTTGRGMRKSAEVDNTKNGINPFPWNR